MLQPVAADLPGARRCYPENEAVSATRPALSQNDDRVYRLTWDSTDKTKSISALPLLCLTVRQSHCVDIRHVSNGLRAEDMVLSSFIRQSGDGDHDERVEYVYEARHSADARNGSA